MTAPDEPAAAPGAPPGPARRHLIAGAGGLVVGTGVGVAAGTATSTGAGTPTGAPPPAGASPTPPGPASAPPAPATPVVGRVPFHGPVQAGITRPEVPQPNLALLVFDRLPQASASGLWRTVATTARSLVAGTVGGRGITDLTITVGVGRRDALAAYPELAWDQDLPAFAREELGYNVGGDLAIQVCATGTNVVAEAVARLRAALGDQVLLRWRQDASRGEQDRLGVTRTVIGFPGGIALPRTAADQDRGVWIAPPGGDAPLAGASFMIVRRLRVDLASWVTLSRREQQAAIGRDKVSGAPLSGGGPRDLVDLRAEDADGVWKIPPAAHTRRAHAAFAGRRMMWRRSYDYANGVTGFATDEGLLFICFVADVDTFVRTQRRLDAADDLMALTTATASGAFLILPGLEAGASWA